MDKRCKDCKYKVYIGNDINEVWGFCSCMDKDLRDITNKYHKELISIADNPHLDEYTSHFIKEIGLFEFLESNK